MKFVFKKNWVVYNITNSIFGRGKYSYDNLEFIFCNYIIGFIKILEIIEKIKYQLHKRINIEFNNQIR